MVLVNYNNTEQLVKAKDSLSVVICLYLFTNFKKWKKK